ncbi:MAG: glycine--tRNA ligase [Candidatus Aenigmatarchaeota archaeon]|nr:MAG: glycine--tRNA ligase [Candidatus Aenigmarchaeota archaeon]
MGAPDKVMELATRRGFVVQSSELYGGLAGFYDYGVLGASMKRRLESAWLDYFLGLHQNFHEISGAEIMPEDVFRASGHLEHFDDPVVTCKKCDSSERADHLLQEHLKEKFEGLSEREYDALIAKHKMKCPKCGGPFANAARLNLMFPVTVGVQTKTRAFLRPETAQVPYVNFARTFEITRKKLPLGLAVVGRAFRNEISPRQGVYRMREFTQAELQIFFDPTALDTHEDWDSIKTYKLRLLFASDRAHVKDVTCAQANEKHAIPKLYLHCMAQLQKFYLDVLGVPPEKFRFYELAAEERAFYNKFHWDAEVDVASFGGFSEVGAVHYRTDHDLKGHARTSGKDQEVFYDNRRFVPHVIEITFGVDRNLYMLLELAYAERDGRTILALPKRVAPYDAAIFPLVNKDGLDKEAWVLFKRLSKRFRIFYDDSGSIGRRYARQDESGTPFCITVDHETLEKKTVTIRDRDTGKQERVPVDALAEKLGEILV